MSLESLCERSFAGAVLATLLSVGALQSASAQDPLARAAASSANLTTARAAFDALPESERQALQDALIWTGFYNGVADGAFGRATFDAISAYQQSRRRAPSGVLNPAERGELQTIAQRGRNAAGFTILDDARTGARIGIPKASLPERDANASGGTRWQSADDKVTLDTRTAPPDATLQSLYDRNLAIQAAGRVITYKVLRPNFLVIAGETATGKFYTRFDSGVSGIRGFSIGYDKALAPQVDRLVVAIANSFDPFPEKPIAATPPANVQPVTLPAPPSDRQVIGTGIVIAPRRVLTAAKLASCRDRRVGGIPAPAPQQTAAWSIIELAQDLPRAVGPLMGATANGGEAVLVLSYTSDPAPSLNVVPGTMVDSASLIAPLQPGASGAPVIDETNRLIGLVGAAGADGRKVAGIMTTARHGMVPVRDFSASLSPPSQSQAPEARGAAAIAASWKPALVPLTCGR